MKKTDFDIFLHPPHQTGEELAQLQKVLDSNWIAPIGEALDAFEAELSALHLGRPVLATTTGTAAIHLSLILENVGPGDEVLVASHTHNASANPVLYQGATPIFVDSESDTWNIDPALMEEAIIDRIEKTGKPPKACILVHIYGVPAKCDKISEICTKYGITIIEDAAEALGATYRGKPAGTLGKYGILSFNGNKVITTGGGGALICPDVESRERALFLATQAREKAEWFEHRQIGYNYRMSNVLAAVGLAQLHFLESRLARKKEICGIYRTGFQEISQKMGLTLKSNNYIGDDLPEISPNCWLNTIVVEEHEISPVDVVHHFKDERIELRLLWKPMHLQPLFSGATSYLNGNSEALFDTGICLPSGSGLSNDEILQVVEIFGQILDERANFAPYKSNPGDQTPPTNQNQRL